MWTSFGKTSNLFGEASPNSLILPIFFFTKLCFLKVHIKFLGRQMQKCIQNPVEQTSKMKLFAETVHYF